MRFQAEAFEGLHIVEADINDTTLTVLNRSSNVSGRQRKYVAGALAVEKTKSAIAQWWQQRAVNSDGAGVCG